MALGAEPADVDDHARPLVAKLDASGKHVWSRVYGGKLEDYGESVAIDGKGNVIVTGHTSNSIDLGGGQLANRGFEDALVAKYSNTGAHMWSKLYGGTGTDLGTEVAISNGDMVVVAGSFNGTVDFGAGPVQSAGYYDVFLLKLAP